GLDTVLVAGLPLPSDTPLQLAAALGAANQAIAPYGLRLEPPRVTKSTADREVRVTPLKIVLGDGTAARPLLGPLMSGAQPAPGGEAAPVEAAAPAAAPAAPVAVVPATRRCQSTSPGRVSGCSRGVPLPASAGALGFAVLLFGGDWWRTRRRPTRGGRA